MQSGFIHLGLHRIDCTNPHHLQQYRPRENCSQTQRRPWSPPADFQILQYVETQRMPGYSCQLELHTSVSYCGLWSYLNPVSSRTKPVLLSVAECRRVVEENTFIAADKTLHHVCSHFQSSHAV